MSKVKKGLLEDMTSYCVKHAYHKMLDRAEVQLHSLDLKVPQFSILAVVEQNPGITQSNLIENLYITRSTASDLIEKLVSRELIHRQPIDRKSSGLVLSAKGEEVFAEALIKAKTDEAELSDYFTQKEIKQLNSLLLKLANVLE